MPLFSAFCGGSNSERSLVADAELSVNCFHATVEVPGTAKQGYQFGTPGLRPLGTAAGARGRGIFRQDGRTWTGIGDQIYELTFAPFTATLRGTLPDDGFPISWASNGDGGTQLALCGGGQIKILNLLTNVLSAAIVLPMTNAPVMIGYLDGYFLANEKDTLRTWFSAIESGSTWDALDFFARSTASDRIVAMVCANSRAWLFGSENSEAYEDVGDADNPFQPIKGSLFQIGIVAPWSLSVGLNTMRWLGQSSRSSPAVYRLDNYTGTRISTHAFEAQLSHATTLADAEGVTIEQDGHLCYALTCPSLGDAGDTLVLDETEQQWHHRRRWNATLGRDEAWRVRGHASIGMTHVVGSRDSGAIWALDPETYDDDGEILRLVRQAPYLGSDNAWASIDRVELGMEIGVGLNSGQGSDPQVELFVSKDLGKTWFSAGTAAIGAMGQYDTSVYWTRLGMVRIDRLVLKVVITDPVKRALGPGLWITATPGRKAA